MRTNGSKDGYFVCGYKNINFATSIVYSPTLYFLTWLTFHFANELGFEPRTTNLSLRVSKASGEPMVPSMFTFFCVLAL